ncbi:hypothetical protein, partial [Nocardioides sp.]|uniref:hypothetical protein n=1 Tax=Nocardioides sp. TaxID=35761 RepID=UPI002B904811
MKIPRPRWHLPPTIPRPVLYAGAAALLALCAGYGSNSTDFWFFVWIWLTAPIAIIVGLLLPRWRAGILAAGAALLTVFTTVDSVYLATAVGPLVFLSLVEDRSAHPRLGLLAALAG